MSPIGRDFLDSKGKKGTSNTIKDGLEVPVRLVRSLKELGDKSITIELKQDNYYHISLDKVVGDKVRIRGVDMKKLARWILKDELQTNMAATSDSDMPVSRKKAPTGRSPDSSKDG